MNVTVGDVKSPQVVSIGPHEGLPAAVVKMGRLGVRRLPVLLRGRLIGILTDGDVSRRLPQPGRHLSPWAFTEAVGRLRVEHAMSQPVLTAREDEALPGAVARMLDAGVGALPVLDHNGTLVGMLTRKDVLRAEVRRPRLTWGSVAQGMNRDVLTVTPETPAAEAARLLRETGRQVLPVLEGEHLAGVVHARDLEAEAGRGEAEAPFLGEKAVRDLMRPPSGHVLESDPLHSALERMLEQDVYGLPVVSDGGRLLGIVTVTDLLNAVLSRPREEHPT